MKMREKKKSISLKKKSILSRAIMSLYSAVSVPVNFLSSRDGRQRLFKEKISYEHQYNSRFGDNYPIRGKVSRRF